MNGTEATDTTTRPKRHARRGLLGGSVLLLGGVLRAGPEVQTAFREQRADLARRTADRSAAK